LIGDKILQTSLNESFLLIFRIVYKIRFRLTQFKKVILFLM